MSDLGVHRSHCCRRHGCKYGDDREDGPGCPVANGTVEQDQPCETCEFDTGTVSLVVAKFSNGSQRNVIAFRAQASAEVFITEAQPLTDRLTEPEVGHSLDLRARLGETYVIQDLRFED